MWQADAAQGADQGVGEGREVETELVGLHGGGAGSIGEQVELALFDAVFPRSAAGDRGQFRRDCGQQTAAASPRAQ